MSDALQATRETSVRNANTLLLSASTLAKRLDISVRTLWRLRSSGKLPPPVHLGGSLRWRAREIDAWIAAGCPEANAWEVQRRELEQLPSRREA